MGLPSLDASTGFLPVGRHRCDWTDLHSAFVAAPQFSESSTRVALWDGLLDYFQAWGALEVLLAKPLGDRSLIRQAWFGGSFISGRLDPGNIDLSLFLDGNAFRDCAGTPGMGRVRKLLRWSEAQETYGVAAVPIYREEIASPFELSRLTPEQREYVGYRGGFDEWWMRARPADEPKGPPTIDNCDAVRGYVEVIL